MSGLGLLKKVFKPKSKPTGWKRAVNDNFNDTPDISVMKDTNKMTYDEEAAGNDSDKILDLESLPVEICLIILETVDFFSLRNLVQSSPVFRRHYRGNCRRILLQHLLTNLGYIIFDAQISYLSLKADRLALRDLDSIDEFLQTYQRNRFMSSLSSFADALSDSSDEDLFDMLTFHSTTIEPLIPKVFEWLSRHYERSYGKLDGVHRPSQSEHIRVLRALYRFQTCCNLFGKSRYFSTTTVFMSFVDTEVLTSFFTLYEPWEIEEINTILAFVGSSYEGFLEQVGDILERQDREFQQAGLLSPYDVIDLGQEFDRMNRLAWSCGHGLRPLSRIIADSENPMLVISHLRPVLRQSCGLWIKHGLFSESNQALQRRGHQSEWSKNDKKMQNEDPMLFLGDDEESSPISKPPRAWTLIWDETFSNLWGDYIPSHFRKVGYVIWDDRRFCQTDVVYVLLSRWDGLKGTRSALDMKEDEQWE